MRNDLKLYPIEEDGRWGFCDSAGNIVVQPRYGTVRYVHDGVVWVNEGGTKQYMIMHTGGKWGLLDASGKVLFEPQLDLQDLRDFSEGVAWVRVVVGGSKALWGLIDKGGTFILKPQFEFDVSESVSLFHDGVSHVRKDGKVGVIETTGRCLVPPDRYNNIEWFEEDIAWVHEEGVADAGWWGDGVQGGKWGVINREGLLTIPLQFDCHQEFSEGVAWVNRGGKREAPWLDDPNPDCQGGLWGLIDRNGQILIDYRFEEVTSFKKGKALVKQDGKWGFIDKSGSCIARFGQDFEQMKFPFVKVAGKWGIINERGELMLDAKYDEIIGSPPYLWLQTGTTWEIYHFDSKQLVTPKRSFDAVHSFHGEHAEIVIKNNHGFVDKNGDIIVEPRFAAVYPFEGGVAWVNLGGTVGFGLHGGKWGLVNEQDEYLIEPKFDHIFYMSGPITEVKLGDKWGYINQQGKVVWFQK